MFMMALYAFAVTYAFAVFSLFSTVLYISTQKRKV